MKFFREAHPSMKKETQHPKGQKLWNTMKNDSEKLSHEIAKLKAKAATKLKAKAVTIRSRNLHMWYFFKTYASCAEKTPRRKCTTGRRTS